jgi:hypothetical protein
MRRSWTENFFVERQKTEDPRHDEPGEAATPVAGSPHHDQQCRRQQEQHSREERGEVGLAVEPEQVDEPGEALEIQQELGRALRTTLIATSVTATPPRTSAARWG